MPYRNTLKENKMNETIKKLDKNTLIPIGIAISICVSVFWAGWQLSELRSDVSTIKNIAVQSAVETRELSDKIDAIDKRVTVIEFKVSKSI